MFKVIASGNEFTGKLRNFELGGDDLVIRFVLVGSASVECVFPKVPPVIKDSIGKMGLAKLKDATLNINSGSITFNNPLESGGNSVKEGKQRIQDSRPRLKLGGGQMV